MYLSNLNLYSFLKIKRLSVKITHFYLEKVKIAFIFVPEMLIVFLTLRTPLNLKLNPKLI